MKKVRHAGPSSYRPRNTASKPPAGREGRVAPAADAKPLGHPHERVDKGVAPSQGFGKIASTGKPRFSRFE